MRRFICTTCGTQYGESERPPRSCVICSDERQYVGWQGQDWTTLEELDGKHEVRIEDDDGVLGLDLRPTFAIDQRACLLPTRAGNLMWESLSYLSDEAVRALEARGGVDLIAISHPHFYSSMGEWSDALGGVPVLIHEADRDFVAHPHPAIEFWSGDRLRLSEGVELIRCGGHFAGSAALHWADGPRSGGALFSGDALQVGLDRRHVSFMYSYPNLVPMRTSDIVAMRERLAGYDFEDVYGYSRGRNIIGGGRKAVDASFDRHLVAVSS